MQRTSLVAFSLVVLVMLAGCNAFFGGDSPELTVTPMDVPTDEPTAAPTATPPPAAQLAPGLTDDGLTNASALLAAHNATLQHTSFTMRMYQTHQYMNGTVISRVRTIVRAADEGNGFYRLSAVETLLPASSGRERRRTVRWSNGEQAFAKIRYLNNTTTYARSATPVDRHRAAKAFELWLMIGSSQMTITPENTTVIPTVSNGTQLYRVTIGRQTSRIYLFVTPQGVIQKFTIIQWQTKPGTSGTITITSVEYVNIGTTELPDRPAWVPTPRNATAPNATTQRRS